MLTSVPEHDSTTKNARALELPVQVASPERVAILLNRNARRVSDRLARTLERVVGPENVFYSRNLEEAEAFSREIVQRGYGTVVCGGGDGTLVQGINLIQNYVHSANAWRVDRYERTNEKQTLLATPRFAFLRLGTGNAISKLVGATDPVNDLKRIVDFVPGRTHHMPLIESAGERFFFAGMGYDSILLNDYNWLKQHTHNRLIKPFLHTVGGYFAALFMRTLPNWWLGRAGRFEAKVISRKEAYYVDPRRGDCIEYIAPGSVLFEGPATLLSLGTCPFYGYGLKIFPFARMMSGKMHLRIGMLDPLRVLVNLPSLWKGAYRHPKLVQDFLVEDISVELGSPYPYQHSGDAQGMRDQVDFKISDEMLRLVDLYPPRRTSY
ncbi:MAG: diacylglycerol kinase family protein [Myxococcota bacterium]|jgi:diacylglycerol kinase family enzyme|nr:diacylglycerol kinase family protein [Myxococcota bacterium]